MGWLLLTLCIRRVPSCHPHCVCIASSPIGPARTWFLNSTLLFTPVKSTFTHQKISLPVPLISLTNVIYRKRVCPLFPMAPAWSWLYSGTSHSGTGGFASVHSWDSLICGPASSSQGNLHGKFLLLWFQFPLLTTHCSGSSTLSPRCLRDAPKSHCNISAARLNHCLTEPILQTSGKAKAASACNQGAGRPGGAGCNCLFKPMRDPHFLTEGTGAEAMRLRSSQWGMRRMPGGWAGAPGPSLSSAEPSMMTHSQHGGATIFSHTTLLQPAYIEECDCLLRLGHRIGILHFSRLLYVLPAISNGLIVCLQADTIYVGLHGYILFCDCYQ